jgi:hypothetical protein
MARTTSLLLSALFTAATTASALAAPVANPLVIELFTSQGCSSCPPADALLGRLKRDRPEVLALDFHVDYWNSLGWRDPFSSPEATARQQAYDAAIGSEVYTPQLVVGGTRQVVGSDRDAVSSAIAAVSAARAAAPPIALSLTASGAGLALDVGAGAGVGRLWLVGFDDQHRTSIGRGENSGRTVTEVNVVRSIRAIGDWHGSALHLVLAAPQGQHGAVLLQAADGRILGAAVMAPPAA